MNLIFLYFLVINSLSFLIFGIDKALAVANKIRVSEMTLLILTLIGGTIGGLIAMPLFRHKISKTSFKWKFSGVVVFQLLLIGIFAFDKLRHL